MQLKQDVAEVGWNWRQVAAGLRSDGGLLAASLLLLEYRFTDFLVRAPLPLYSRVNLLSVGCKLNATAAVAHVTAPALQRVEADCGQNNARRPSHRPNYTCAYGRLRFCRPLKKKKSAGTSHATPRTLVNFSFRLKEMVIYIYIFVSDHNCFVHFLQYWYKINAID